MSEDLYKIVRPQGALTRSGVAASARVPQPVARPANPAARYIRNPLVDSVLEASRTMYQNALNVAEPPTLFNSGDLPAATVSGIDPQLLLDVPWQARHAVAAARTQAEAAELIELASGPDADETIRMFELDRHEGNRAYQSRVDKWVTDGLKYEADRIENAKYQALTASSAGLATTADERVEAMLAEGEQRVEANRHARDQAILDGRAIGHGRNVEHVRSTAADRQS
jgi:hypothetical protein